MDSNDQTNPLLIETISSHIYESIDEQLFSQNYLNSFDKRQPNDQGQISISTDQQQQQNIDAINQLKKQLTNGFKENGINNILELQEKIQELKTIIFASGDNQQDEKYFCKKQYLEKLEVLESIQRQIDQLNQQNIVLKQNTSNSFESSFSYIQSDIEYLYNQTMDKKDTQDTAQILESMQGKTCLSGLGQKNFETQQFKESQFIKVIDKSLEITNLSNEKQNMYSSQYLIEKQDSYSQNYLNKLLFSLDDIQSDILKMPVCSERCLLSIIYYSLLSIQQNNGTYQSKQNELIEQANSLIHFLQYEDLYSFKSKSQIKQIQSKINQENWVPTIQEAEKLLKQIRPFNIQEFFRLIKKAEQTAKLIEGKDIILFIGGTGAGKSTTIHFLAGSKMIMLDAQLKSGSKLHYIGPDPQSIQNQELQKVTIGYQAESETRYITPVSINPIQMGITIVQNIVLVDTPGLQDTKGPEVDFANQIGVVQAVYGCNSIRPAILISQQSFGDKGEGIKNLAHSLAGLVNDIDDKISSFSYIFTKFPPNSQIKENLENIQTSIVKNVEENSDEAFMALFQDIVHQTTKKVLKLDPIKDEPYEILKEILRKEPIRNPQNVFKISINENSKQTLKDQVNQNKQNILSAIKRKDYNLVCFRLDELKQLIDVTKLEFIKSTYEQCINSVIDPINNDFNDTTTQFNNCFKHNILITQENIHKYKMCVDRFQYVSQLRDRHLGKNVANLSSLTQNLMLQVNQLCQGIDYQNIKNISLITNLNNIKLISSIFTEVEGKYKEVCQNIKEYFKNIFVDFQQNIQLNQFNKLAEILSQIQWSSKELKDHLNDKEMDQQYQNLKESLKSHLDNLCKNNDFIFQKEELDHEDIDKLNQNFCILEQAKDTVVLQQHISYEELNNIHLQFTNKILKYFNTTIQQITNLSKHTCENTLKQVYTLIQQLELIREIRGIKHLTSDQFFQIKQEIVGQMERLRQEAEHTLMLLQQQDITVSYDKVFDCLKGLRNGQWIEGLRPGTYTEIMKKITEILIKHSNKLNEKLLDLDLSLQSFENIPKGLKLIQQIEEMTPLEEFIGELSEILNNIKQEFKISLIGVFYQILMQFNFGTNNKLIQEFEEKQKFHQINKAKQYLKKYNYQSVDSIIEEINLNENECQQQILSVRQQIKDFQTLLSQLQKGKQNVTNQTQKQRKNQIQINKKRNTSTPNSQNIPEQFNFQGSIYSGSVEENEQQITGIQQQIKLLQSSENKINEEYTQRNEHLKMIQSNYNYFFLGQQPKTILYSQQFQQQQISQNQKESNYYSVEQDNNTAFRKLDGNLAENAIKYLEACKNIKLVCQESQSTLQHLNDYFTSFTNFLENQIQEFISRIITIQPSQINDLIRYSYQIASQFQNIKELESNQLIFKSINGNQLIQRLKFFLKEQLFSFSGKVNLNKLDDQQFMKTTSTIKALSQFDFLFTDIKFLDLNQKMQNKYVNDQKEQYQNLQNLVQKNDFVAIQRELQELSRYQCSDLDLGRLSNQINTQITGLVEETKKTVNFIGNDLELNQIKDISQNLNKIQMAKKHIVDYYGKQQPEAKPSIYLNFKKENSEQLEMDIKMIKEMLDKNIKIFLISIKGLVYKGNLEEADKKRDYICKVWTILRNNSYDEKLAKKLDDFQTKYQGFVKNILNKYQNMDVKDYIFQSPKNILDNLSKIKHSNQYYEQAYQDIRINILENIRKKVNEAPQLKQKMQCLQEIEQILPYIPDDLKNEIERDLSQVKQETQVKVNKYEQEYNIKILCKNIKETFDFLERCQFDGQENLANKIQTQIVLQAISLREDIIDSLHDVNKFDQVLNNSQKLKEFKDSFGKQLQEIEDSYKEVNVKLNKKLFSLIQGLKHIETNDDTEQFCRNLQNLLRYIEFQKEKIASNKVVLEEVDQFQPKIEEVFRKLFNYFSSNQKKFDIALQNLNFQVISQSLNVLQQWKPLLNLIRKLCNSNKIEINEPLEVLFSIVENCKSYEESINQIENIIDELKMKIISFKFIEDYKEARNTYYKTLETNLITIQKSTILSRYIPQLNLIEQLCINQVIEKLQSISEDTIKSIRASKGQFKKVIEIIRLNYENINSIESSIKIVQIQNISQKLLKDIKSLITEQIEKQAIQILKTSERKDVAESLIQMKILSTNIPTLEDSINKKIDETLVSYINKSKQQGQLISALSAHLESDEQGIGFLIIQQHRFFQGQSLSLFNQKSQKHDFNYILQKIEGDNLDKDDLKKNYNIFKKEYDDLLSKYLAKLDKKGILSNEILNQLITSIKDKSKQLKNKQKQNKIIWDNSIRQQIPNLLAQIFALWTLNNSQFYLNMKGVENRQTYLQQPHDGQVVAILRLFRIGYEKPHNKELYKNLVQIGTGQGKSIVLGVTAAILALVGLNVSCACYSQYHSDRDYNAFLHLFDQLEVTKFIQYGTFHKICENIINSQGDIRQRVINQIKNEQYKNQIDNTMKNRPSILLLDEADFCLGIEFYGIPYTPLACLKDPVIEQLINFIWANKNQFNLLKFIEESQQYKDCCNKFQGWDSLINHSVKNILTDLKDYKHEYLVINDKIAYKEHDGISFEVDYSYKTLFAYYHEHEKGRISRQSLNENIFIRINCGYFSYAEIYHQFQCILGVTGTLQTLNTLETKIIQEVFEIQNKTIIPSVFGQNLCIFRKNSDVFIENADDYFMKLANEIGQRLKSGKTQERAVLVFFESKERLMKFYQSKEAAFLQKKMQIITEEISNFLNEKELYIRRATTCGQITLLTKVFGRGTDFTINNQILEYNDGVHVIQTFLSHSISEEIQIKGRAARQGQKGSFSILLLDQDLEQFLGSTYEQDIKIMRENSNLYDQLQKYRDQTFEKEYQQISLYVKNTKHHHIEAEEFIKNMDNNNKELIQKHLEQYNKGNFNYEKESRICLLMDATGSMGSLLKQVQNTVCIVFERAQEVLKNNEISEDSFKMQFVIYRDYDQKEDILKYSTWESNPENLRQFMSKIKAIGGEDYEEAIEIGLQHVNIEDQKQNISQVILIGDAPSKSQEQIIQYKNNYGGEEYWKNTIFKDITHYQKEIEILKKKQIPINTFYLRDQIQNHFQEIAAATGGICQKLDIDSPNSSEILTNIVTEQILKIVGQVKGRGEDLINDYREKFVKTYKQDKQ